jgi:hypothetical protein
MFLVLHQWICKAQYPLDLKGILATTTSCRVPGPRYWFVLVHWYMYVPSIVSICQYISLSIEDPSHHVSDNLFKSNDSEFMIYKCVSFLTSDMYTMYIHVLVLKQSWQAAPCTFPGWCLAAPRTPAVFRGVTLTEMDHDRWMWSRGEHLLRENHVFFSETKRKKQHTHTHHHTPKIIKHPGSMGV